MNDHAPSDSSGRRPASPARGAAVAPGFHLTRDDIFFILFRHKWLIAGFALAGVVGSFLAFFLQSSAFRSEAKVLVRYVVDARGSEGAGMDGQVRSPSSGGDTIINSEIEILTSLDLCEQAALAVGLEKVLQRPASTNESLLAGIVLKRGLVVDVPRKSNVIKIALHHRDPEVAVRALSQLVDAYQRRHVEVHRAVGAFDSVLSAQTDQFRNRLATTESRLRDLKTNFIGATVEDARKSLTDQLSKIRQDIFLAEAQFAEYTAVSGRDQPAVSGTNIAAATNAALALAMPVVTNAAVDATIVAAESSIPPATFGEYRALCTRLDTLRNQELDLIGRFTDGNILVKNVREQLLDTQARKQLLENEHPGLLRMETSVRAMGGVVPASDADRLHLAGVQARLGALTNQLIKVRAEMAVLDGVEGEFQRWQRTKELEEKNYRYYAAGIEQARFNEVVAGGKLANISVIEAPTPPMRDASSRFRLAVAIFLAGLLGGLALAFLIELLLDRTLKRPGDVEDRLHLPLFVSMPRLQMRRTAALPEHASESVSPPVEGVNGAAFAPEAWSVGHPLRPFFESLRDRTLLHFDGITRKPKLLGVTGCGHGSGVTTTAAGLAAALSETGGGNVLLVDLNLNGQTAHPFFQGRPGCGLADAMENDRRESGLITGNLYMALARNGAANGSDILPKSLAQMVPQLRVSDYDFIVFDMPRVTQTGITARLAGMLDLVLLVVESEKEQQDVLRRARGLLVTAGATVGAVLNKVRAHVPRRLRSQFYEPSAGS